MLFLRDAGVLLQEFNDLPGRGGRLSLNRPVKGGEYVLAQVVRRVDADLRNVVPDLAYMNFAHPCPTASTDFMKTALSSALSLISTTCSTPFSPSFTGTPENIPFTPYSPSRNAEQGSIFFLSSSTASTISSAAAEGA